MILHSFTMVGTEDPEIYAAEPILDWEKSEAGQWVMANSIEKPSFHIIVDHNIYGYRVIITGDLTPEAQTFFTLKYK